MNLLQLIQQVTGEMGLSRPAAVIGSTDAQIIQFYSLLNRLGLDLARQYNWQRLIKEGLITTVSATLTGTTATDSAVITGISSTSGLSSYYSVSGVGIQPFAQILTVDSATQVTLNMAATASGTVSLTFAQTQYALPSDWQAQLPQTEWDRTNRWPLMGPESSQDWQSFKSGIVYSGPRERFRIRGNTVELNPIPANGLVLGYEYKSKNWVYDTGNVGKSSLTADTDSTIFDDSLLITGLKAQFKIAKGLDATADLAEFRGLLDICMAQDHSAPVLSLSGVDQMMYITNANIKDGSWAS